MEKLRLSGAVPCSVSYRLWEGEPGFKPRSDGLHSLSSSQKPPYKYLRSNENLLPFFGGDYGSDPLLCMWNAGCGLWVMSSVVRINIQGPTFHPNSPCDHWQTSLRLHTFVPNPHIHNFKYIPWKDLGLWFLHWQTCEACRWGCWIKLSTMIDMLYFCAM